MYDQHSYDTACVFLDDDPDFFNLPKPALDEHKHKLAQLIQDTIEDYLQGGPSQ